MKIKTYPGQPAIRVILSCSLIKAKNKPCQVAIYKIYIYEFAKSKTKIFTTRPKYTWWTVVN